MSNQEIVFRAQAANALVCSLILLTGATGAWAASNTEKKAASPTKLRADTNLPAASNTIFWGVDKDGSVTLTDRPDQVLSKFVGQRGAQNLSQGPGAAAVNTGSATFAPANDAAALARAQREREYWRDQADRFQLRQRDRERELEETRRLRLMQSQERDRGDYTVPIYARSAEYFASRGAPYFAGFRGPSVYTSSPGAAAAAGPAAFIGSGFSTSGRR